MKREYETLAVLVTLNGLGTILVGVGLLLHVVWT